eukprot:8292804-Lingulodinium_polyedra.AAC.1
MPRWFPTPCRTASLTAMNRSIARLSMRMPDMNSCKNWLSLAEAASVKARRSIFTATKYTRVLDAGEPYCFAQKSVCRTQ